jgi:hypothetical protein
MIVLRYIGYVNELGDPTFLDGVPARDLTELDIAERELDVDALVDSGLYERVEKPAITAEQVRKRIQELEGEENSREGEGRSKEQEVKDGNRD